MGSDRPNDYARMRDISPAVALARCGRQDGAEVLRFSLQARRLKGPDVSEEDGPAWVAYALARLGDPMGLDALRHELRLPLPTPSNGPLGGEAYYRTRIRKTEAAGCILALAREAGGMPLVSAPALHGWGPLFYPDCLSR
jgi:hypothetical protein